MSAPVGEMPRGPAPIVGVPTANAAFVDFFAQGPMEQAVAVTSFADFERVFGGLHPRSEASYGIAQYFTNGGSKVWVVRVAADPGSPQWGAGEGAAALLGDPTEGTGLHALERVGSDPFGILCLPAAASLGQSDMTSVYARASRFCRDHRAFFIADLPATADSASKALEAVAGFTSGPDSVNPESVATYFPRLEVPDPLGPAPRSLAPSGTVAGVYARMDARRGVFKAPAGAEAHLMGGASLRDPVAEADVRSLKRLAINALITLPNGSHVAWGARTLAGAEGLSSDWRYIPVRRTALFIETSLIQGVRWAVYEPNDETLWARLRVQVAVFMHDLFRQGAFQGSTPDDAYFVQCDARTTTQADVDDGIVNIVVGFAPLQPAEFVVLRIQQLAAQAPAPS